jgi:MFS family permease
VRRLLALVSAIVLVETAFYSAITPLLPEYTDALDLSKGQAGMLAGSYAAGTLLAALPAGLLAARVGARRVVLAALLFLSLACATFGFAESYGVLLVARFTQGLAGACAWAAGLGWLAAAVPRERRGTFIGAALGMAIAGQIGGPVIGAAAHATSTEVVFSAVAVVSVLLGIGVLGQPPPPPPPEGSGAGEALRERRVLFGAWLMILGGVFYGTFLVLTPLRLDALGLGAAAVGAVFLCAAAAEAVVSPVTGRLADVRGRVFPIRIGLVGITTSCVLLPLPGDAWLLVAIAVASAAIAGAIWAPANTLMSDGAEDSGMPQTLAFGMVNFAWAGGMLAGAAGGAALAGVTADAVPYGVLGVLCATTLLLVQVSMPRASRAADSAASS